MSSELAPFITGLKFMYNAVGHANYQQILDTIEAYPLSKEQKSDLKLRFPRPGCVAPAVWESVSEDEDFTEAYATDPRDPGPLSEYQNHGWIDDADPDRFRQNDFYKAVQQRTGIRDLEVLDDIRENTLHILGRCNNPKDWGENKQGLVYGMVQSGKTASMINLISMGIISGYRLFIILAGDKDSLRKQSQKRINDAFRLSNGINTETRIHSPTFKDDFSHTGYGYTGTFKTAKMAMNGEQYTTIIVMKKWTSHIEDLVQQIKGLDTWCTKSRGNFDLAEDFPTLIIDDEADYASQNTNPLGDPSATHAALVSLRKTIPRNCYAAYTATPQACLSANPNDLIGYPNDFFWLLEPFKEQVDGRDVTRSYLGAWDVFWEYDDYLVKKVGRNEWPHYEKDDDSGKAETWIPGKGPNQEGHVENESNLEDAQKLFLEEVAKKIRPLPPSLISSLIDFVISAGVRWWDHWKQKDTTGTLPGKNEVSTDYPHHAIMIHLSRLNQHQLLARKIVEIAWEEMKIEWNSFDINQSPEDHTFQKQWKNQRYRTQRLKPDRNHMKFSEVHHFMKFAIEIAETPIRQDIPPYKKYPDNPFTYLVNSDDESGMRLYYDKEDPWEIKTNRAAIIVGGQILSRGLTIEGLTVSFFGRTAKMPMGDTVLQMGRWFGHKKTYIDLISIYMQDGLRILFRHIADADRHLRVQIKDAIFRDLRPDEILLELRNSPQFRATSPNKSRFVHFGKSGGFSGRRALLREPTLTAEAIKDNNSRLKDFELKYRSKAESVHNRAEIYRNIPVYVVTSLLRDLKCRSTATQDSYSDYARYLDDWVNHENVPQIPRINIAIMNDYKKKRKRELSITKPMTSEQARASITGRYGAIVGGAAHGTYRGDYFLDKDEDWHDKNKDAKSSYVRKYGRDDILLVFYRLQPNYITSRLWDPEDTDEDNKHGKWRHEIVELQRGDRFFIDVPVGKEKEHSVLVFAAFTPRGGPQYGLGVNTMLDPAKVKQRGLLNYQEELLELEEEI